MKWLIKFLDFIYTKRIFSDFTGQIFMDRYYLIFPPWNEFMRKLPNVCFHRFHAKDNYIQEVEHDHARWCISFILTGGYVEIKNGKRIEHRAPAISIVKPNDIHQVISSDMDTCTFFFVGPRFRLIKFYNPKSKVAIKREEWTELGITLDRAATPELLKKLERRRRAYAKLMKNKTVV